MVLCAIGNEESADTDSGEKVSDIRSCDCMTYFSFRLRQRLLELVIFWKCVDIDSSKIIWWTFVLLCEPENKFDQK